MFHILILERALWSPGENFRYIEWPEVADPGFESSPRHRAVSGAHGDS